MLTNNPTPYLKNIGKIYEKYQNHRYEVYPPYLACAKIRVIWGSIEYQQLTEEDYFFSYLFPLVLHPLFNRSTFATSKTKNAGKHAKVSGRK